MSLGVVDWGSVFDSHEPEASEEGDRSILGSLVYRRMVYSRKGVCWLSVRAWRHNAKDSDMAELKRQKALPLPPFVPGAAEEIAVLMRDLLGSMPLTVTNIACGHSRRSDCAGAQLSQEVAARIGQPHMRCFEDRFASGSSHPLEYRRLPPLVISDDLPRDTVVIVDDVATSGWHIEEALNALRSRGISAVAIAWISGTVSAPEA